MIRLYCYERPQPARRVILSFALRAAVGISLMRVAHSLMRRSKLRKTDGRIVGAARLSENARQDLPNLEEKERRAQLVRERSSMLIRQRSTLRAPKSDKMPHAFPRLESGSSIFA